MYDPSCWRREENLLGSRRLSIIARLQMPPQEGLLLR
jgi:hypothetical protein